MNMPHVNTTAIDGVDFFSEENFRGVVKNKQIFNHATPQAGASGLAPMRLNTFRLSLTVQRVAEFRRPSLIAAPITSLDEESREISNREFKFR